ncbi:hypothetical protein RDWZM_004478 [Blomia tropicalis]|uniref:Micro-fibrillar-associated protein 1 C-terminal domain-containing protein n=1 Tax=Blomia tropicalis TaxID=40697 RepID=A0A9Q0MH64_BLOTA|nr:Microfibrillar-associated protein 1 [Blomia tropicalis]KAJ6225933.1 hypothetical protein RDWZM_004478 [Blomia tropicalis]
MSYHTNSSSSSRPLGAVPIRNEKGEITMQKVKVQRYISGRKPKYAEESEYIDGLESSDDEMDLRNQRQLPSYSNQRASRGAIGFSLSKPSNDNEDNYDDDDDDNSEDNDDDARIRSKKEKQIIVDEEKLKQDPRMQRLMGRHRQIDSDDDDLPSRRNRNHHEKVDNSSRPIVKPQLLSSVADEHGDSIDDDDDEDELNRRKRRRRPIREVIDAEADNDEGGPGDENVERRHESLKQRMGKMRMDSDNDDDNNKPENDNVDDEDVDDDEEEDDDDSEYEYSEDEGMPRLKPIFVSKQDRITIIEKETEEERRLAEAETAKKLAAEERRRTTMKIIENERRREEEEEATAKAIAEEESILRGIAALLTDDEDDETGYELWKVRELKRIKREKEEEEARDNERHEIERLRNMTEEERQAALEANPREITNKAAKGKYKFMQKYYHRGVFYLDEEHDVFKRDVAQPTLEDHFDKTVLPSVMQVKNFGRAGRTKYTHLVDQDTTAFDHAWGDKNNTNAIKFHSTHGGGMKQSFERPGKRKK